MHDFGIGRLAALTGVKISTIRFYEQIGLLNEPGRTEGGQRRYDKRTVRRLSFVRHARELGFDVDEVRELLTLADRPDEPCQSVDAIARRQVGRIDAKIKSLRAMRRELMTVITGCHAARVGDCRIIEALSQFSPR
jgi:DNA-binding transcriptional MerR regulator